MDKPIFFLNGKFISKKDARIPIMDLGILRGYGVFDYLRTYKQTPFCLNEHIDRLYNSAKLIELEIPWKKQEIRKWIISTLNKNNLRQSQIRIVITGGQTEDSVTPKKPPTIIILVTPLIPYPQSFYKKGIKTITFPINRYIPEAKSINYIPALIALTKAKKENAVEAIYVDEKENLLEGTTSNLFIFKKDLLITAEKNILKGITRKVVLKIVKNKFKIEKREIKLSEIPQISEAFVTASNKEVMPIVQIDKFKIGKGKPGKNTKEIITLFKNFTRNYKEI